VCGRNKKKSRGKLQKLKVKSLEVAPWLQIELRNLGEGGRRGKQAFLR
jgi:hypothetical protein